MTVSFDRDAWDDYVAWQHTDSKIVSRINALIRDIARDAHDGIGKPEPLQHAWAGWWSRRIDREHRLVYRVIGEVIQVAQCRYHY
jgi:toxin YoeB